MIEKIVNSQPFDAMRVTYLVFFCCITIVQINARKWKVLIVSNFIIKLIFYSTNFQILNIFTE